MLTLFQARCAVGQADLLYSMHLAELIVRAIEAVPRTMSVILHLADQPARVHEVGN